MGLEDEFLTLDLKYHVKEDRFEVGGTLNEDGRREIVANWLRGQMGSGRDNSKPADREVYSISIQWYPDQDRLEAQYDTGNKGLREGILMRYLETLE
jgi:hypothetical protein